MQITYSVYQQLMQQEISQFLNGFCPVTDAVF